MIVPQVELAGVHLLMSEPGVRRVLGKPKSSKTIKDEIQGTVRRMDYGKTKVYLSATADGTVFSVTTTDRRQKTAAGIGVGSSRAAVARKVRSARCTARVCVVGTERAGKRVTAFALRDGRVVRVTLGFVID
ncbi:hypothetical protein [Baekduia sp. Peel2402]|uniref:hypothetical protein n=1 Tax=Baekduia sp. Peel2402 TaxID=3458296 RepID=UPI00403ED3CF